MFLLTTADAFYELSLSSLGTDMLDPYFITFLTAYYICGA